MTPPNSRCPTPSPAMSSFAVPDEDLALRNFDVVRRPGDRHQLFLRAGREERHLCQVFEVLVLTTHRHAGNVTRGRRLMPMALDLSTLVQPADTRIVLVVMD